MFGATIYSDSGRPMLVDQEYAYVFSHKMTTPETGTLDGYPGRYDKQYYLLDVGTSFSDPPMVFTRCAGGGDIRQIAASVGWRDGRWNIFSGGDIDQVHYIFIRKMQLPVDRYGITLYRADGTVAYHSAYKILQIEFSGVLNQDLRRGDPDYPEINTWLEVPEIEHPAIACPVDVFRSTFHQQYRVTNYNFYVLYEGTAGRITNQYLNKSSISTYESSWPPAVFKTHTFAVINSVRYD